MSQGIFPMARGTHPMWHHASITGWNSAMCLPKGRKPPLSYPPEPAH